MTREELSRLRNIPVTELRREELSDAEDIKIDMRADQKQRIQSFLKQTRNPFAHNVGGYILQVDSMEGAKETWEDCMVLLARKILS